MKQLITSFFILLSIASFSQSPGDTIIVETFNYTQTHGWPWSGMIRDTMIDFPDDPDVKFEKVIMLYNMRCKDGLVSTASDRDKGCGEWDYSCNTYITDSSRVDSVLSFTADHYISAFSGTTFSYVETPLFNYQQYRQKHVQVDAVNSENIGAVGGEDQEMPTVLAANLHSGKSQFLYTGSDLTASGLVAGNIDALQLKVENDGSKVDYLKIALKHTEKDALSTSDPDLDGFNEVYFHDAELLSGMNNFQFHTPFDWDGSSNIIVEFSFTNNTKYDDISIAGSNEGTGIYANSGFSLESVNGKIELPVDPFNSISDQITVSFWSYGNELLQPSHNSIVHANDAEGKRTLNIHHPWGNGSIYFDSGNEGGSYDRIDKAAIAEEYKGSWQHWAFTKNATSGEMKIFLNGELWHSGTDKARLMSIYDFVVGTSGTYDRTYFGKIDELRVWDVELSQETIAEWMRTKVTAAHPNYNNLVAYYMLDEADGDLIMDNSSYEETATIDGFMYWVYDRGDQLNRGFYLSAGTPKVWFAQGDYDLTITDVIVTDSVDIIPNIVREYEVIPRYGTMLPDSINESSVNEYWQSGYVYTYDPEGALIDSTEVVATDEIEMGELEYFNRYPMKFEIMSFVTPYGIYLDLGMEGKTWAFDVTDYGPILQGAKRMTIERGGQWQEDMDIKFMFIVGTPPRDVLDVQQLWRPDSKGYTSIVADRSFEPRDVLMNPLGEGFKIRTVITGHGQQGEFIGRNHYLKIDDVQEFSWKSWTECSTNPIYPQGGTWIYDRAGWCPGQASDLVESDITDLVTPGAISTIDYGVQSASGTSNYIVNNQLVTYGGSNFSLDAAIVEVLKPNSQNAKNDRFNPACMNPEIVIQNTGSETLYTLEIEYYEDGGESETYKWTGVLEFLDTALVVLPINDVSFWTPTTNRFVVKISEPNSLEDEYEFNNQFITHFDGVDVYPEGEMLMVELKTNNRGYENSMRITDNEGNILKEWDGLNDNQTYSFPLNLDPGCYKLRIDDSADDGLYWWHASTQGVGSLKLLNNQAVPLYIFEPEFGRFAEYEFGVGAITKVENKLKEVFVEAYPNPANNKLNVEIKGSPVQEINIRLLNTMGSVLYEKQFSSGKESFSTEINLTQIPSGVYFLQLENGSFSTIKKIVKQ